MHEVSYLDAIREAQVEEMERDADVLVMGQDMRASLYGSNGLVELFGEERVLDLPTSETASVGTGVGAAMTGLRPVVDMTFACFTFVAMDQFISQVAKARYVSGGALTLPVTYRILFIYDAGVGVQHSDRPHPMFMAMPGLKVVAPTTPADAKGLLKSAIRDDDPVIIFEDSYLWDSKGEVADGDDALVELGTAAVRRPGDDVTIVGLGRCVGFALAAAEQLAADGISAEVIDLRSLAPIDWPTIFASVEKTGRLVAVDPAVRTCSAASEIVATVAEQRYDALRAAPRRVASPRVHSPYTSVLEHQIYPDAAKIAAAARAALAR
jgi:acetoin:2,6-dichlorophenolindophenol oxidoreductase subunit beta